MADIVIGTAGHIDHGKTTLIKALTGIDTDTTEEEKNRGMSINLGFGYIDLPNGERAGIIDVPGHEKFIKNMLAGASGIHLVILVIDANEGIMPQTIEHTNILQLLGIENFIIALTKVASIDTELLDLVIEDIREQFKATPLENAPIIKTDAINNLGLDELKEQITISAKKINLNKKNLPPRLNIDRSFSSKGFGTVITGTLMEGILNIGDELVVYPSEKVTKIRNIQVYGKSQKQVVAGNRTALNLNKVNTDEVKRGDVLTTKNNVICSYMLDTKITCVAKKSLSLWDRVHLHIGTKTVLARLVPIGVEEIFPKENGFLQLRLEEPVFVKKGDHFILRSYSPVTTIAGGTILDINPKKHKRFDENIINSLKVKEVGNLNNLILDLLDNKPIKLYSIKELADYLNEEPNNIQNVIYTLLMENHIKEFNHKYISIINYNEIINDIFSTLDTFHEKYPLKQGMFLEEFRTKFKILDPKIFDNILNDIAKQQKIIITNNIIKLPAFKVELNEKQQKLFEYMENILLQNKMSPVVYENITQENTYAEEILNTLDGTYFIKLDDYSVIHKKVYDEAVDNVIKFIKENKKITLAQCRDMLATNRKYALLLLEKLDKSGITKRIGDARVLQQLNR